MSSNDNSHVDASTSHHVYIRSKEEAWIPGRLLRITDDTATVEVKRGNGSGNKFRPKHLSHETIVVQLKEYPNQALPLQNVSRTGELMVVADMVDLPFLHESAILFNLKARHAASQPYTRTGSIIVAVNPYQWINTLYTEECRRTYSRRLVWEHRNSSSATNGPTTDTLDPHVYEVSALAYRGLALEQQDQSILVSGESGAGKTETVKICLQHIASVQRGAAGASAAEPIGGGKQKRVASPAAQPEALEVSPIVQRILDSNPLLEAFGNAKTIRNDNSSRFGKYLQLQFHSEHPRWAEHQGKSMPDCRMVGSECEVYLLEKSRVVSHHPSERTFHVMYQLLAAPEATKREIWPGLAGTTHESFCYVGATDTTAIEGVADGTRFAETVRALAMVQIEGERLQMLWQAVCVVLQLGNLTFASQSDDEEERSHIASIAEFAKLTQLMGVQDVRGFEKAFTERRFEARGETLTVTMSEEKAKDNCDAFAKEIYSRSFLWLVRQINNATSTKTNGETGILDENHRLGTIGLLDIFGFETFESNGFEQLCINYANEMIQQKFTQDVFTSVMHEYEFEGIALKDIRYDDNTDVLDLIEGRSGLLAMLNEECFRPNGNDATFVRKAILTNKESPALMGKRMFGTTQFGIIHYAGSVVYEAEGFVYKNTDHIPLDLLKIAQTSSNGIISKYLTEDGAALDGPAASAAATSAASPVLPPKAKFGARSRSATSPNGRNKSKSAVSTTVWSKFKTQLNSLMGKLVETETRYIRCIKPNSTKSPLEMEQLPTVEQLRCAGVVAAVTISRSAFPNRLEHSAVLSKFKSLWPADLEHCDEGSQEERARADVESLLTRLLDKMENNKDKEGFVCGLTRTYFRAGALEHLETLRLDGIQFWVADIQRLVRGFVQRRAYQKQRAAAILIQSGIRQHACRVKYRRHIRSAVVIQCLYRSRAAKKRLAALRTYTFATRIQAEWRCYSLSRKYTQSRKSSVQIQRIMRGKLERLRYPTIRQKRDEQLKMADQIAKMRAKLAEEEDKKKKELTELKRLEMQREQENRMQKLKEERLAMEQQLKEIEMEKELQRLRDQIEQQKLDAMRPPEPKPITVSPAQSPRSRSVSPLPERAGSSRPPPMPQMARMARATTQPEAGGAAPEIMTEEQKRLMEESGKIIEFLRKENLRLKKKAEQQRKDFATLKENNQRLMEANSSAGSSFQSLNQHARQLSCTNQKLLKTVAQYRNRVTQLHANIKNRQKYCKDLQAAYKMETEARAFYEQTLLTIVDKVSTYDCHPKIQELVLEKAVVCAQMSQRVAGRAAPDLDEEPDLSVSEGEGEEGEQ